MDAVVNGLIGGSVAGLLIVVGGVVALYSDLYQKFSTPSVLFAWVSLLSALTVGQLYLTWSLVSSFAAAPSQTTSATVS